MSSEYTMVACAHCGAINPYRVRDSFGWLVLHCTKCYKQFKAIIENGVVVEKRVEE